MQTKSALAAALTAGLLLPAPFQAANHREAPLTALDHKADIADFFAFVSYDDPDKVTFIMTVDPRLEPSNGPNYFPFDPEIQYTINVDNNHDAVSDVAFQFRFKTDVRLPGVFTGFVGAGTGIPAPMNSPAPIPPGTPIVPPAITALDGPGSEGLSLRQTYSVTLVRGDDMIERRRNFAVADNNDQGDVCVPLLDPFGIPFDPVICDPNANGGTPNGGDNRRKRIVTIPGFNRTVRFDANGDPLVGVPSNIGPRTMPDYPALADQGLYDIGNEVRVFAGTVEDPFWIDLGAAFDSLNFRPGAFGTGVPGVLDDVQDADDATNFAPDDVAGFNVNAIAVEIPIALITQDGRRHGAGDPLATIGAWGTTSRPRVTIRRRNVSDPVFDQRFVQIQRMANPLFNGLIIGTGSKDDFSMSRPKDDSQFADFALDPVLARVLNALYEATVGPGTLPVPDAPRLDLLPLVQYIPPVAGSSTPPGPVADLLRLNTGVRPTAINSRSRLGFLTLLDDDPTNDDPAGYPNGRRVSDDVTDIAARVVAGVLAGPDFNRFPHNRIGDGVNANDAPYRETFPYLGYAHSGVESRHVDPGETCQGDCP